MIRIHGGAILLVDDERIVRTVAGKMLEKLGYDVLLAEDGREAVEIYQAHQSRIAAVLLDMTMAELGGEETLHLLRKIDPEVRILLSSGYTEQEMASHLCTSSLTSFVQKPYRLEMLATAMNDLLGASAP